MLLSRFPEEVVNKYKITALAVNGWVNIEIRKGVYGLKQACVLANQLLQKRLSPFGYFPARHTPGMWLHKRRSIAFSLRVDDFTFKYMDKQHADHLRDALLHRYELTTDWEGKVYSGMSLKLDYKNRTCDMYMPGYVSNILSKSQDNTPKHPQHRPPPHASRLFTAPNPSMQRNMIHLLSRQNSASTYKKLQDPSCTMKEQWTPPS
jgi:hypothetical protein